MPLKPLADYNNERRAQLSALRQQSRPNGLACPDCGKELRDVLGVTLTSDPPRTPVECECGYTGSKLA